MKNQTTVRIQVTTLDGLVGGFNLNFHEDLFVADALDGIRTQIEATFGKGITMNWGSPLSSWGVGTHSF